MKKSILISTSYSATHCWPDCPIEEVSFLKHPHRHVFHVVMRFEVSHNNRDIEFIQKKILVDDYLSNTWNEKDVGNLSCEDMAEILFNRFEADYVSVLEDNENGAEVYKS